MAEATGFEPVISCVTGMRVRPSTPRLRILRTHRWFYPTHDTSNYCMLLLGCQGAQANTFPYQTGPHVALPSLLAFAVGGRTRVRTWDPLLVRQVLYH